MFAGLGLLMISVVIFCLSAIRVTRQNVAQTLAVPKATLLDQMVGTLLRATAHGLCQWR
jgi:hypothetical protein